MANQPRPDNPRRSVRIEDRLWFRVQRRARADGVTPSAVIRAALAEYLEGEQR